jgi:hypothetical protein
MLSVTDPTGERLELDEQDKIAIRQMLTLTPSGRLAYLVAEVEFNRALGTVTFDD